MNKILPALFKFLEYSPVVLAVVLPLLFIPATTEYFETAKVGFLYIFVSIVFVVWCLKMVSEKKVGFMRSGLDLPFVLLAVAYGLAAFLSPDKYTAVFGSYLRFQPSLLFILALIVLYYTLSANLRRKEIRRLAVVAFVLSVGFSCAWALLNFLGVFEILPLPAALTFLKSRAFNTAGSLSVLSVLAAVAFTLGLGLLAGLRESGEKSGLFERSVLTAALFPLLAVVLAYSTLPGWLALVVGLAAAALFELQIFVKQKTILVPLLIWAAIWLAFLLTPSISKSFNVVRPAEVTLSLSDSWIIASQTLTNAPLTGGGLGRFPYLFTIFKPLSFNATPFWNLRFDRPSNELLLVLSETGLVGLAATLFFLSKILSLSGNSKSKERYLIGVQAGLSALAAVYLVTTGSALLGSGLILLLSVFIAGGEEEGSKISERVVVMISAIRDRLFGLVGSTRKIPELTDKDPGSIRSATQILPYLLLLVSILTAVFFGAAVFLGYGAEYFNRLSLAAVARNDGKEAYNNQVRAISFNPNLDVYQRNLAQLSLGIAANLSARPNVSDADKQTISDLIQESIRRARIASEIIGPVSVANWETRAQIYQNLIGVAQGAEQWAVDAYARAISLDPTNPNLRILLGGIYFGQNAFDQAQLAFGQAVSLKPDLANAHYNLAQALLKLGRKTEALTQYDITLNLVGSKAADYNRAKKERDDLAKQIKDEAQKAAPSSAGFGPQEPLKVSAPEANIQKENVAPPPLNLGQPNEASPSGQP